MNKAFQNCVQCGQFNDGTFDSCKVCTIKECRNAIKNLNFILDHFGKVVKAAKRWQTAKEIADKNPARLLSSKTAEEATEAGIAAAKVMDEYFGSEKGLLDSLSDLEKAGIKVKV